MRALLCQNLCLYGPKLDKEMAFTVGLFSLLPGFLDIPLEEICKELRLPEILTLALTKNKATMVFSAHRHRHGKRRLATYQLESSRKIGIFPDKVEELCLDALKKAQGF